ncbi:OPT oligopeptide transporter protein-domain-containing protein [Scheffersomyces xylosifermentans]|uniref:OPT oligopeptide transporter protein-domain-containing protein n=1 Tax=Scheffersomyces xylosifermentans TaxID=1304137 RepID=UPI00315D6A07
MTTRYHTNLHSCRWKSFQDTTMMSRRDQGKGVETSFQHTYGEKLGLPQVTLRATIVGLAIGSVVLVSNFQFGLQTGWVSMMSLPAALLGFTIFKVSPYSKDFTDVENVYVQSVAVAVGTGPLCYGLIGIVPAIEKFLTSEESGLGEKFTFSLFDLMVWSLGLGLFGVFFAVPLRKQVIIKEKLPFPSGSATATLISVMHGTEIYDDEKEIADLKRKDNPASKASMSQDMESFLASEDETNVNSVNETNSIISSSSGNSYNSNINSLVVTFLVSAAYTLLSFFVPILKNLPIFGSYLSNVYKWNFQPSPAYIGQGIIMGLPTVSYMLFGAILGWGILAPLAKSKGWAPGEIDDWIHGGQGWILWISLSVMISDSLISFAVVTFKSINNGIRIMKELNNRPSYTDATSQTVEMQQSLLTDDDRNSNDEPTNSTYFQKAPSPEVPLSRAEIQKDYLVSNKVTIFGIILSSILCIISIRIVFGSIVPYYAAFVAIILALFFSVLGVRALGETDLNPVSGIGKLSQLIFALVIPANHPSKILINLVAGGVAEAGAQQAGDLMQDLKTGHLIGASPKAQFIAQIIGTLYSVFLSSVMYKVYNSVYDIPGDMFRIPTAIIWIDCSRLVTGQGLPPKAFEFSIIFGVIFGIIALLKNTIPPTSRFHKYLVYLPSGVAVGIGIYNSPNFTLARFLGGVIAYWWVNYRSKKGGDSRIGMIIFSSGLVLGEGLLSVFTMLLTSMGVKHL